MAFTAERPVILRVATVTSGPYQMTEDNCVVLADATGGAFTVLLPDPTGVVAGAKTGLLYTVKRINSGGNAVTVDGFGADTIDGAATVTLSAQYQAITVASNGTNWFQIMDAVAPSSGAPTTADYLVGTAQAGLSAEIVVGASPGGELGGTWGSPTVDATHSGSAHHTRGHVMLDGGTDHTDTAADGVTEGSIIVGNSTPAWDELPIGATLGMVPAVQTASPKLAYAVMPAQLGCPRSANIAATVTTIFLPSFATTPSVTEGNCQIIIPYACRLYNLYVFAQGNSYDGPAVCTVRKNGADTALTATITAGSTATFSDTTNVVAFAAGDKVCLQIAETATTGTLNMSWSVALRPDLA